MSTLLPALIPQNQVVLALADPRKSLLDPNAVVARDELLERSQGLERVIAQASCQTAANLLNEIDAMLKAAEESRKHRKDPFFQMGKRIDDAAKTFTNPLDVEKARLKRLMGAYQAEQLRIQREAQRKQEEELERLRQERLKAEAAAALAETTAEVAKAQEQMLATDMKAQEVILAPTPAIAAKPENIKVKQSWKVTVTDPAALYRVYPECVELKPKMREIQQVIKQTVEKNPDNPPVLPGCVVELETDVMSK